MREMIFTVDKISDYIKNIFDAESLLKNIQIRGEISSYGESGGNAYFILKGKTSQIPCVYFGVALREYIPSDGDNCIVSGSVSYYKKGGKVTFNVTNIMPDGMGDSYIKFLQLKDKLEKSGVFDPAVKKPLPFFVSKLGVVTSKSGAVIHDIMSVAEKKYKGVEIFLYSSAVQGKNSEFEVERGIETLDKAGVDAIIVARGGGSAEDLMPFNTERVAMAVYRCKTPLISAVGHQTDYTLCDLAADVRAATPTAAAEMVLPDAKRLAKMISDTAARISESVEYKFEEAFAEVKSAVKDISHNVYKKTRDYAYFIKFTLKDISFKAHGNYLRCENLLSSRVAALDEKNPLKLLKKGYSVVTDDGGNVVGSVKNLKQEQILSVSMYDGDVKAQVKEIVFKERL
jgi:exodeoxyribonuclease VII large subunit